MRTIGVLGFPALALALGSASVALAAPSYSISTLGLTDLEHTHSDGFNSSFPYGLNEAGHAIGYSLRNNGGNTDLGQSAWFFDGASTVKIGLTGPEHTRSDGFKFSSPYVLKEGRQVYGSSNRYDEGSKELGRSAWLYDGATTVNAGLTGPEHTRNDGYKFSQISQLSEAGQALGESYRYNAGTIDLGRSVWLYDAGDTMNIGLIGPEYTRNDGYKLSGAYMNDKGLVIGVSARYNGGSAELGTTAWLYDGATTIPIGLTGIEHTNANGYTSNSPRGLNAAGQVSGHAIRYNGIGNISGQSAWIYDSGITTLIGLTGPEHTRNDGYKSSFANRLNESGHVIGFSARYNGSSNFLGYGQSAWLYNGRATMDVGLTGHEHTRIDGFKNSFAEFINDAGQVIGYAERYNGGSKELGQSAWFYNGTRTIDIGLPDTRFDGLKYSRAYVLTPTGQVLGSSWRFNSNGDHAGESLWLHDGTSRIEIGLFGPEYTSSNGTRISQPFWMNSAGQVVGHSWRFDAEGTYSSSDAWFYDPLLNETIPLNISSLNHGYSSNSGYLRLSEDGQAFGTYTLFDSVGHELGTRAFYFTMGDGLHDLGSLVQGGLTANGWDSLVAATPVNSRGQILGNGKLISQSSGYMGFLLTPVIPEPSGLVLAAFGTMGLLACRRL
jgi:Protein of unknown function (DUF3466)